MTLSIRNQTLQVDYRSELEAYEWTRPRWTHDKLIAASPFRYDNTPSFFVNLESGGWGDSGAYDTEYERGNFVKLLAFLRNETLEEAEDYLLETYGVADASLRQLIAPHLRPSESFRKLPESIVEPAISPYLTARGISEEVQRIAGVGRSSHQRFVAIPWRKPDGTLANVKYRATRGKTFFYESGVYPVRRLVWGADSVTQADRIVVCEAEIDAMSWRTAGIQAVAIGGVSLSVWQADILRRLPCDSLVLAGDNDKAGRKFNEVARRTLKGVRVSEIEYGTLAHKDANEILREEGTDTLRRLFEASSEVQAFQIRLSR